MNQDDPRMNKLIKEGTKGQIVILGCPFDYAKLRCINKGGEDSGPCCLRRFYHKVGPLINPQYNTDISKVSISDAGNIQSEKNCSLEQVINKITSEVKTYIKNDQFPFVFGGSKQSSLGSIQAFYKIHPEGRAIIISGKPTFKRMYDNDKLTSDSLMTMLNDKYPSKQILFGTHSRYLPQFYDKNFSYISLQEIRKHKNTSESLYSTQAGEMMRELVQEKSNTKIHLTLAVQAIQGFKGSRDIVCFGLQVEQLIEIFHIAGKSRNFCSVDITEFNPSCEDYQSSLIILNLLYYFLIGWSQSKNYPSNIQ